MVLALEDAMRWLLDILAVLTASALIVAVFAFERERGRNDAQVARAGADLRRMELEIKYRSVTKSADLNELGWPVTVDAKWFDQDPPRNTLVTDRRPWVEVASEDDADLLHPRVRIAVDETVAGFWYNPYQGVVRARVPIMLSDADSTALYNRLNGSSLTSLFDDVAIDHNPDDSESNEAGVAVKYKGGQSIPPVKASTKGAARPGNTIKPGSIPRPIGGITVMPSDE